MHTIALSGRATPEIFFDLEKASHARGCPDASTGAHIFVSGLARAGTTLLLRMLYETGEFASLTYRDMPLVMAPNFWKGISAPFQKSAERKERAHGDGMLVDFDSPEALEEVFWRTFCAKDYIHPHALTPMDADTRVIEDFRQYVALILKRYERKRYLSKNNNSILRLPVLAAAFPNAHIITPFREPRAHAASLWGQHKRFLDIHAEDAFSRKYMNWLAHFEFGASHRPFVFNADREPEYGEANSPAYWLERWIEAYDFLLKQAQKLGGRAILFSYDRLVSNPEKIRASLFKRVNLNSTRSLEIKRQQKELPEFPGALLAHAGELHEALMEQAKRDLPVD